MLQPNGDDCGKKELNETHNLFTETLARTMTNGKIANSKMNTNTQHWFASRIFAEQMAFLVCISESIAKENIDTKPMSSYWSRSNVVVAAVVAVPIREQDYYCRLLIRVQFIYELLQIPLHTMSNEIVKFCARRMELCTRIMLLRMIIHHVSVSKTEPNIVFNML